jgi:RNA polymerase sigma-32 factor
MVKAQPELDAESELALARRYKNTGDEAAREALVKSQLRHVVSIAFKYRRYRQPLAEMIAEGNFGLVHAVSKYDPERGNRLVTYSAYWIRAYVLSYVTRTWSLVGGGSGALRTKLFFKLRRERSRLTNLLGEGEEVDASLARSFGLRREKLQRMLRHLDDRDLRLDAGADGAHLRLLDTLPAPGENQEESALSSETGHHVRIMVRSALTVLDQRERYIAERRLMAEPEEALSLSDIGLHFGVSRERARQIEARAKRKLRARMKELDRTGQLDVLAYGSAA